MAPAVAVASVRSAARHARVRRARGAPATTLVVLVLATSSTKSFSFADSIILSSATHLLHIALIKIKDICNSNGILIAKSILKNKEMLR